MSLRRTAIVLLVISVGACGGPPAEWYALFDAWSTTSYLRAGRRMFGKTLMYARRMSSRCPAISRANSSLTLVLTM